MQIRRMLFFQDNHCFQIVCCLIVGSIRILKDNCTEADDINEMSILVGFSKFLTWREWSTNFIIDTTKLGGHHFCLLSTYLYSKGQLEYLFASVHLLYEKIGTSDCLKATPLALPKSKAHVLAAKTSIVCALRFSLFTADSRISIFSLLSLYE